MGIEDINEVLDNFEEGVAANRAKISETTFNEVFKPVFEGRVEDNKHLIQKWVELAGDEYSRVDLVGEDGNVVATVSGILKPLPVESREEYKEVLHRYERATSVMRINPVKGQALSDQIEGEIKQGLLPSNAKSREYITYVNEVVEVEEDMYDI